MTVELKNDVMKIRVECQEIAEIIVTVDKTGKLDFYFNSKEESGIPEYQNIYFDDENLASKRCFLNMILEMIYEYYSDKSGLAYEIWLLFNGAEEASDEFPIFSLFLLPLFEKKELFKFQSLVDYAKSRGIFEENFELPVIKEKMAVIIKGTFFLACFMLYQLIFGSKFKNKEFLAHNFFVNSNKLSEIMEIVNELPKTEVQFHFLCCYVTGKFECFGIEINDIEKAKHFLNLLNNIKERNDNLMKIYELNSIEEVEKLSLESA